MEKEIKNLGFDAHWCIPRKKESGSKSKWRPYNSVLCSCCPGGENSDSIDITFPDREVYEGMVESRKSREKNLLDDGWRN